MNEYRHKQIFNPALVEVPGQGKEDYIYDLGRSTPSKSELPQNIYTDNFGSEITDTLNLSPVPQHLIPTMFPNLYILDDIRGRAELETYLNERYNINLSSIPLIKRTPEGLDVTGMPVVYQIGDIVYQIIQLPNGYLKYPRCSIVN